MIIFDGYSFSFKIGNKTKFKDGKCVTLLDITKTEYNDYLARCREVEVEELYYLPKGTILTYIRRDNRNIIKGVVIDKQYVTADGDQRTMVIVPNGPSYVSRKASAGRYTYASPMRFSLHTDLLSRLFVVDEESMSDRMDELEKKIKDQGETIRKLALIIKTYGDRIMNLQPASIGEKPYLHKQLSDA